MYSNYNDKHLNNFRSGTENLAQGFYQYPNTNYYSGNMIQNPGFNQFNYNSNINTIQTRNNILKSQYPEIYNELNNIIDDILPKYRNITITEEILNNMTDEILTSYTNNNRKETEADNRINKNSQDKNVRTTENNILRDLIKIILITRLIKLNLDNICSTNRFNNYYRYNEPYGYNMQIEGNNLYMGYQPQNYF